MIFAAGLGTRLRPLTDDLPKALVPVAGTPVLERVATRLVAAGAHRLVINVHAYADLIREFVERRDSFGVEVLFSPETDAPLETGGGLLRAAPLLELRAPIFLHNTDVITDLPLARMYDAHGETDAIAMLAVNRRQASRYLLFDEAGLCGKVGVEGETKLVREVRGELRRLAFCGVHVVAPSITAHITERGEFSIVDAYLRLVGAGHRVLHFDVSGWTWLDIGSPERLARAELVLARAGDET